MRGNIALQRLMVSVALAGGLALLMGGCGKKPSGRAEQFIGNWTLKLEEGDPEPIYPLEIKMRPDGTAVRTGGLEPHPHKFTWLLYGDKLIMTPQEGVERVTYDYQFNGPDELVLTAEDQELRLVRLKPEAEGGSEMPSEEPPG